ncbi:MAG: CotH kinase family protein [Bacteroidia bacterium]|nr:CotH kinase family protein [Bacteroidia bacterium]
MNLTKQFLFQFVFAIFSVVFLSATSLKAQFNNNGDAIFNSPDIHVFKFTFTQPSFWDSLIANYYTDLMMQANVEIDGVAFPSPIGVQLKGNSSFTTYPGVKKSIKVSFDEYVDTADFHDITTLNLNNGFKDPTMLREKMCLDFCKRNGINAPRCTYAKVYLNNEFWGFYTCVEQVGKIFCKTRFNNKGGNLYKGDPTGDLRWYGAQESQYYDKYEKKTNESQDWSDLVRLIDNLNNEAASVWKDSLEATLNVEQYIRYWAANVLFVNLDSYTGSGHNYYIYHDDSLQFFQWIMWDVNESFGNFNPGGLQNTTMSSLAYDYIPTPATNRPLNNKLLADSDYRQRLKDQICSYIQSDFNSGNLEPQIDSLANRIRADYYSDPNKMYSNSQFEDNINNTVNQTPGLKSFISERVQYLNTQLGCPTGVEQIPYNSRNLMPNPFSNSSTLIGSKDQPTVLDVLGRDLSSEFNFKYSDGKWLIENPKCLQGFYFLHFDNSPSIPFVLE